MALVLTTGGRGCLLDVTPEATLCAGARGPGIPEAMRYASLQITPGPACPAVWPVPAAEP